MNRSLLAPCLTDVARFKNNESPGNGSRLPAKVSGRRQFLIESYDARWIGVLSLNPFDDPLSTAASKTRGGW